VPLLQIRDLKVWFPIKKGLLRHTVDYVRAVDEVSLDIPQGQIVALVGESGCGKTTLGRAVLQLEKPTSGSIQIDGQELTGLSARELRPLRRKMQIAFQDPQSSLNPRLLVETTLTEPMKVHGIGANHEDRIELASQLLESVQLNRDFLWRYPHEFSGGQRQRIGFGAGAGAESGIYCLRRNYQCIGCFRAGGNSAIVAEHPSTAQSDAVVHHHNIGVVEYLSDQTVVMYKGKIVEQGQTAQICSNPKQPLYAGIAGGGTEIADLIYLPILCRMRLIQDEV